jgi:hypothetical protein
MILGRERNRFLNITRFYFKISSLTDYLILLFIIIRI